MKLKRNYLATVASYVGLDNGATLHSADLFGKKFNRPGRSNGPALPGNAVQRQCLMVCSAHPTTKNIFEITRYLIMFVFLNFLDERLLYVGCIFSVVLKPFHPLGPIRWLYEAGFGPEITSIKTAVPI